MNSLHSRTHLQEELSHNFSTALQPLQPLFNRARKFLTLSQSKSGASFRHETGNCQDISLALRNGLDVNDHELTSCCFLKRETPSVDAGEALASLLVRGPFLNARSWTWLA
eukprot:1141031-Pelagomonas_calceolata.AAC.1